MDDFKDLTGQYKLCKTLRFKLIPIGKTLDIIKEKGLLEEDQRRADDYQDVKKLIDNYHKAYIERVLKDFHFNHVNHGLDDSLEEYFAYYHLDAKDLNRADGLANTSTNLRKQLVQQLVSDKSYARIFKKKLIEEDLPEFVNSDEKAIVDKFKDFTTYFSGFNENRKNMYSDEAKSTAIAYRVVHENLPRFIDNIDSFKRIVEISEMQEVLKRIYADFEEYLNVKSIEEMFCLNYYDLVVTQKQIDVYNMIIGGKTDDEGKQKVKGLNEYINLYNQQQQSKGNSNRLGKLKMLYKQILSDKEAISWLPEMFETDNQLLEDVEKCYVDLEELWQNENNQNETLDSLLISLPKYDLNQVYVVSGISLSTISQKLFGQWSIIQTAVENDYVINNPRKKRETEEKFAERKTKYFKSLHSFSIAYLDSCLVQFDVQYANISVADYFRTLGANGGGNTIFEQIQEAYQQVKNLLNTPYPSNKNLAQDKDNVERIKALLDAIKELQHFVKPLLGNGDEPVKDEKFYGEFTAMWDKLDSVTLLYNNGSLILN